MTFHAMNLHYSSVLTQFSHFFHSRSVICKSSINWTVSLSSFSSLTAQFDEDNNSIRMYMRGRPVTLYVPEKRADALNYDATKAQPAPSKKLKLDWVSDLNQKVLHKNPNICWTHNWHIFFTCCFRCMDTEERTAARTCINCQPVKLSILSQQPSFSTISTSNHSDIIWVIRTMSDPLRSIQTSY